MVNNKIKIIISTLLVCSMLFAMLQTSALALNGVAETNVTDNITFSNGQLSAGETTITSGETNLDFVYNQVYTFSIDWQTKNPSSQFDEGDYFVFLVPDAFAPESGFNELAIKSTGGQELGVILISPDGTSVTTFNKNIENLQELSGSIELTVRYTVTSKGVEENWQFVFGAKIYEYSGSSTGNTVVDYTFDNKNIFKNGAPTSSADTYYWNIFVNQSQSSFTGAVTITDNFGLGYVLKANPEASSIGNGFYGLDSDPDNPYFSISIVDWNTMRADYNQKYVIDGAGMLYGYSASGLIADGDYSAYMLYVMLNERYTQADENAGIIPSGKTVGSYKYMTNYTGALASEEKTSGGFEIVFPEGALNGQSYYIKYYVALTSAIAPTVINNDVTAKWSETIVSTSSTIYVSGSATATGSHGQILLYKQNSGETEYFEGVEFKLINDDTMEVITGTTDNTGMLAFKLTAPYNSTYTLIENPDTAPSEYICADPIELELDSSGEIICVNGMYLGNEDLILEGICHVSKTRLVIIVYNDLPIIPESSTVTLTASKTLIGGELTDDMFSFVAVDENDTIVASATNKGDGTINFTGITIESPGTYTYKIIEQNTGLKSIDYDGSKYTVTVQVVDNGDGTLSAEVLYPDGGIEFVNKVISESEPSEPGISSESDMPSETISSSESDMSSESISSSESDMSSETISSSESQLSSVPESPAAPSESPSSAADSFSSNKGSTNTAIPKTGDNSSIILFSLMITLFGCGLFALIGRRKNENTFR